MVPPYYWGMQLQIPRCLIMVGRRLRWVASRAAVLLGNATADLQKKVLRTRNLERKVSEVEISKQKCSKVEFLKKSAQK